MAFYPVHSCNLQAINAMGRSDMFLKLEIIKKAYGMALLVIALVFFDSPIAIVAMGIVSALISSFVNASPNKKLIGYSYLEQLKDILPSFLLSLLMFAGVSALNLLPLDPIPLILIQIASGVLFYVLASFICKPKPYRILIDLLKTKFKGTKKSNDVE